MQTTSQSPAKKQPCSFWRINNGDSLWSLLIVVKRLQSPDDASQSLVEVGYCHSRRAVILGSIWYSPWRGYLLAGLFEIGHRRTGWARSHDSAQKSLRDLLTKMGCVRKVAYESRSVCPPVGKPHLGSEVEFMPDGFISGQRCQGALKDPMKWQIIQTQQ